MKQLTIDQALQQAIEAHKIGQVREADRLYTAILKAKSKHPDANHNMGVLAVGIGKVAEALPFFKTALEAHPANAQFWLSYIDALIKLNQLAAAKIALNQAKSEGVNGDAFSRLEQRVKVANGKPKESAARDKVTAQVQQNILNTLKLDQAVKLAKKKIKGGSPEEAKRIYQDILSKFPKNKRAIDGFNGLSAGMDGKVSKLQNPTKDQQQSIINLYNQGQLTEVVEQARALTEQYPEAFTVWNILAAAAAKIGKLDESIHAFRRAIAIKPNYADAYNNMGTTLKAQNRLEEAVDSYKKALVIRPNFAEAYYNMAIALKDQSKLDEAIQSYNFAIALKPNYAEAYNNMGVTLQEQGKLVKAIEAYKKAIAIQPDYAEAYNNVGTALQQQGNFVKAMEAYKQVVAIQPDNALAYNNVGVSLQEQGKLELAMKAYKEALTIQPDNTEVVQNSLGLAVQLLPIITNYEYDFDRHNVPLESEFAGRPKYQVQQLIKTFLEANFSKAYWHNNNFKACNFKLSRMLSPKDKIFCYAYSNFIGKLLESDWNQEPIPNNTIYHLGESHCLSYAHRNIKIGITRFRITPRIVFGAKAYHFYRNGENNFKAITKAHLTSLPQQSKVFISFGEIDCRANEGFIAAAKKLDKPIKGIVDNTAAGYLNWFIEQNKSKKHHMIFFNIPAPTYDEKISFDLNLEITKTVSIFNDALKKYAIQHSVDIMDVFQFTSRKDGFSNDRFHLDAKHLGFKAVPEIERQLR